MNAARPHVGSVPPVAVAPKDTAVPKFTAVPRVASGSAAPAQLPPPGLAGMDPQFSRLVTVPGVGTAPATSAAPATDTAPSAGAATSTWHILDNDDALARLGRTPVGTILCVHGNPTWSYLWRRLVSAATDAAAAGQAAWRVIAVDQLEMGFSERTGTPRPLATRVRDLDALTTTLGLTGPVVTLGHDWGGVVSLGWAVDHPDLLAGVMVLNTAVHQPSSDPIPAALRLTLNRAVFGAATVHTPGFLETTLALAHPRLTPEVRAGYRAPYGRANLRAGIGAFVADIPVDSAHVSSPELDRIAAGVHALGHPGGSDPASGEPHRATPALMLWGPRDPIFSDRYLADLIDRMPDADVHRFEGAGHMIAEDVDYADAVLTWLRDTFDNPPLRSGYLSTIRPNHQQISTSQRGVGAFEPMWHQLDALADSTEIALVEMAPGTGAGPRIVSWQLLAKRVEQLAAGLTLVGVRKGHRVSLLIQPGADLTAVLYACLRIGAVVVVADAGLGLRGLTRAVRGARPHHVIGALPGLSAARALNWPGQRISSTDLNPALARALGVSYSLADIVGLGQADNPAPAAPYDPDAQAAILFTSGSTGPAKGVVYTHRQLCAMRDALAAQYGIGVGTGLVAGFAPFALLGPALGARSVTPDMDVTSPGTLTARAVAEATRASQATIVFLSPAAIAGVVATAGDLTPDDHRALGDISLFLSAGAPVSEHLLSAAATLMPNASAHTPYGMTEGLLVSDISLPEIRAALARSRNDADVDSGGVCVGRPGPGVQVRIFPLDASGTRAGDLVTTPGVTGEIVVEAPHIKDHYDRLWLTERDSRRVPHAGDDAPRWHRTGDVGHLDPDGRLWIEGRLAHVWSTASGIVTPVGVEQRIETLPEVSRSAVVGVGPVGAQVLVAVVELVRDPQDSPGTGTRSTPTRPGLASRTLAGAVRSAAGRELAAVLVVPHLPTDIRHNSKIDRTHLATWAADVLSGSRMRRP